MSDIDEEKSAPNPCGPPRQAAVERGVPETVIGGALLRVAQDIVGFVDLDEATLGLGSPGLRSG